jgi:uncharacterized radical SAM superfamily protein
MHTMTPPPEEVIGILCRARLRLPRTEISLGCARPRGNQILETLAIDAGVNRMVLPSEETLSRAKKYDLAVAYHKTCCSVDHGREDTPWMRDDIHRETGV